MERRHRNDGTATGVVGDDVIDEATPFTDHVVLQDAVVGFAGLDAAVRRYRSRVPFALTVTLHVTSPLRSRR
jgi:hypothetical protein